MNGPADTQAARGRHRPRRARTELLRALPPLLVAALLLAFAAPLLDPAVQLFDRDTGRCEYPFKHEMAARFAAHQLPLWVPWTESGTSLLGQLTPALFHPATLLFLALPFDLAFKLDHLLALALAALGAFLLARKLGAGAWGAAAAAATYAGSGWMVSMAASNVHYAFGGAAVALSLHAFLFLLEAPRPWRLLWSGFSLATAVLAGEPQSAIFAVVLGAALALTRSEKRARPLLRVAGWAALWALCGLCLSAPAALPAFLRMARSDRDSTTGASGAFALPPLRALGLVLPWAFDEQTEQLTPDQGRTPYEEYVANDSKTPFSTGIALGAPALLCALALGRRRGLFLWLAALLCLAAATGPALHVDRALQLLVPPLSLFRYPEKFLAPLSLLLSLAAGLSLSRALEDGERPGPIDTDPYESAARASAGESAANARRLVSVSLGFAAAAGLAWLAARCWDESLRAALVAHGRKHAAFAARLFADSLRGALATEAGLALLLAAAAGLRLRGSPPLARFAAPLAASTCALSVWLASSGLLFTAPVELLHGPFPLADELRARSGEQSPRVDSDPDRLLSLGDLDWRLGGQSWMVRALATQLNGLQGIESAAFYTSLGDRDYIDAWHAGLEAMTSLFAVRFQMRSPWAIREQDARARGYSPTTSGMWIRERDHEPRAFLVGCARALEREDALRALGAPGFAPRREALLDREQLAPAPLTALDCANPSAPGDVAMARPFAERIELSVDANRPALVVLSEHFDPGWTASIDGGPELDALQIDRAALGAWVPQGRHAIVFRFFPTGLRAGLCAALACVFALALAGLARRLRAARPS